MLLTPDEFFEISKAEHDLIAGLRMALADVGSTLTTEDEHDIRVGHRARAKAEAIIARRQRERSRL